MVRKTEVIVVDSSDFLSHAVGLVEVGPSLLLDSTSPIPAASLVLRIASPTSLARLVPAVSAAGGSSPASTPSALSSTIISTTVAPPRVASILLRVATVTHPEVLPSTRAAMWFEEIASGGGPALPLLG